MRPRWMSGLLLLLGAASLALAQPGDVRIDITRGQGTRIRIHCEALAASGDRQAGETRVQADEILSRDLEQSAVFVVSRSWGPDPDPGNAQAVVTGSWKVTGNQIRLTGEVRDVARRPILVKEYKGTLRDLRQIVHRFADDVVLQFTGEPGVAQTHIAFAVQAGRTKELHVVDFDGANLRALTRDKSIALSPAWAPDGSLILFTSYRAGAPQVYVIQSAGGRPYLVSGREGLNASARYSPNGREIALTLSQDGNPEIYSIDARGKSPKRLTNHRAIDTSPAWSPTGQEIAFTSDRSGTFQVYVMDREGGNVRRLTYEVGQTDSPDWSPKGDRIAFVAMTSAGFDVYVCRPDGSGLKRIASGASNENPRWSPDGRHLVFASNRGGRYALYVSDLDDRPPRKLDIGDVAAVSPAWSPRPPGDGSALNLNR